ncbi:MAG TPA: hypothetical protein VJI67_04475, partial [archaeon]|nr:hypothetical protein [archaeon]
MALRVDAWFFVGLAALLFFYSAFVFHYDGFTSADSFERQRAVESILSTGFPPKAFNAYSTSDSYVYPPFFDYLTAFLVKAFGASMVQAWGFMGVALAASAYVAAFFLAFHYFKDSASSALAAFFTATATRFARIEAFPSPESLGIVFSLVVFCLFFTQKSRLSGLLLGFTLWVHFRSFLTTLLLVVGFLAAWPLLGLKPKKGLWSDFLLPSIASMAVFLALFPSALSLIKPFHNPFILSSTPLQVFGPVFFLGFAGFALAHASREFSEVRLFYSFLVLFLLSGLLVSGSTFYRELLYFSFPVAFFSS